MAKRISYQDDTEDQPTFKIQNNILIGNEMIYPEKSLNAGEVILGIFKSKPEFIGQVDALTGRESTYGEMWERTIRCALWLKKQGIQRGDTIAFFCDNYMDGYAPFIASLCIGAIFTPDIADPSLYIARRHLSITKPKVIFLHGQYLSVIEEAMMELNLKSKLVLVDDTSDKYETMDGMYEKQSINEVENFRCETIKDPKEPAIVLKTSGTTGPAKYAELSQQSMRALLHPSRARDIVNTVAIWASTVSWVCGVIQTMKSIRGFAKRVIILDDAEVEPICEYIDKYKVEHFSAEPSMVLQLIKTDLLKKYSLRSLKTLTVSGACFKREQHEAIAKLLPRVQIIQLYGSTDGGDGYVRQQRNCKFGSCGFVIDGAKVKIVDYNTGEILGANKRGEICAWTPTMLTRYYKNPEATRQAFDSDGWLRTGDVGYYDEDGEIFVVDRLSQFIKYRSISLSPTEIEAVLEKHPAIYEAAVIPARHDIDGERPLAIVSKLSDKKVTRKELEDLVAENLPEYYLLRGGVKFVDKLPRTNSGKIIKNKLIEMYSNGLI